MDFLEGLQALELTSNGHEAVNALLYRAHGQMIDTWSCDEPIPKCSDKKKSKQKRNQIYNSEFCCIAPTMDFLRNPCPLHILTTVLPISTGLALRLLKHIVLTLIDHLGPLRITEDGRSMTTFYYFLVNHLSGL